MDPAKGNNDLQGIKQKLENYEKRIRELELVIRKEASETTSIHKAPSQIARLAKCASVEEDAISRIFDVEKEQITILKTFGDREDQKTQNTALLTLVGYKYLLAIDEILSSEIKRNVAENGIPLNNFATHLNKIAPSLIRRKGKARSTQTVYKLTVPGEIEARKLIKAIHSAE